ncbi:DUF6892 domain-containing protein [Salegentibacter maritimus]|uniref:Uncharacterized protein n=1 Tax=Salegentibacter maritimus TaxID=2794347 RepID=A0ABS0TJP4_9FLAO|nr:hypothetical protein [Salegentibacter maritimus]MBI6120852.1 hypothetical protein [Salegentibacter maritimus]
MTTIQLSSNNFEINSVTIAFPLLLATLEKSLNTNYSVHQLKHNTVFTWDELGILAYSKNGKLIDSITIVLEAEDYNFSPNKIFSGTFYFENKEITKYYKEHEDARVKLFKGDSSGALVLNNLSAWFSIEKDQVKAIEVSTYVPYKRGEGIPKDKYLIKSLEEETINFTDFGFKLSVIEELMYTKNLLKPVFDLYEFADWYQKREIDIDKEAYEPIEEVVQYFKDLPIPKRLAAEITEIYQDGGNDIYMNLAPFSGGAVEYWDIESSADAKHFPNLKKATLCYAKDQVYDDFIEMGIDAEWL